MKYRSRLEIIADTLKAVGNGAKKTRIMYVANLSYKLLENYLDLTLRAGLVRFNNDSYEVTEKGQAFLERFDRFSSRYSKLNRELEDITFEREVLERMCELAEGVDPQHKRLRGRRR